jgi:hypothetical protein
VSPGAVVRPVFSKPAALTVIWQSATIGLIGVLVGVPVGLVVGRVAWQSFATNLGVVPLPVVEWRWVGTVALGTLAMAGALAIWPAVLAVQSHAADRRRTE